MTERNDGLLLPDDVDDYIGVGDDYIGVGDDHIGVGEVVMP